MTALKTFYTALLRAEELLLGLLLVGITVLVFSSAVTRAMNYPIIWATDISTLFFAWEVFLGGDYLIRHTSIGGVELVANRLPPKAQKALKLLWFVLIVGFCAILAVYGTRLCLSNTKRMFQGLPLSYSWCTLSVPVGSLLMIVSSLVRIREILRTPAAYWKQAGAKRKAAAQ